MLETKRRAIIFFLLSLLLAMTAGFLVLKKVRDLNDELGTMVNVFVAKQDITSRTMLTPDDVTTIQIPKRFKESYHITKPEDMMNMVSVVPLSSGDIIMKNMLKQVSNTVDENNRLITLMGSDRVLFDEPLEAMDRVDIIVSHKFNGKEETSIFMKDVKIARVAKKKDVFKGVMVEIPLDKAPELIHMQNYADSVRIIKANVGKGKNGAETVNGTGLEQQDPGKEAGTGEKTAPEGAKTGDPAKAPADDPKQTNDQKTTGNQPSPTTSGETKKP